jgi:hypothetical protein
MKDVAEVMPEAPSRALMQAVTVAERAAPALTEGRARVSGWPPRFACR